MLSEAHLRPARANQWLLVLGIVLTVAAFWGGLVELVGRWYNQEEYGHGFFLPLISAWMLWSRRVALRESMGAPSGWGLAVLALSGLMLVLGEITAIFVAIQVGFLVALLGLMLCFGGWSLLRLTLLPIAFLLFAIPLPYFIDSQISWRLQLISSSLGVDFLRAMGYSVFLEGNIIDFGTYKLQVIEACSGLRYLYPLLSIGFLMAYIYPAAMHWRVLIFISVVPITVLTNSARISLTGVLVGQYGSGVADGFLHYFEGWIIFIVCQLILMAEIMLIERFTRRRHILDVQQFPEIASIPRSGNPASALDLRLVGAAGLLALAMAGAWMVGGREEEQPARLTLKTFPLHLGDWVATESSLDIATEQALGFEDYVLADYRRADGDPVNFYVAYYASQRKGVSPHSPQVCIPGGGWVISQLDRTTFALADGQPMEAVRVVIDRGSQRQIVYYWFEQRGRRIANEYWMKWYLFTDAITRNRTDGALVRVVSPVRQGEAQDAADQRIQDFIRLAEPHLDAFVPI